MVSLSAEDEAEVNEVLAELAEARSEGRISEHCAQVVIKLLAEKKAGEWHNRTR